MSIIHNALGLVIMLKRLVLVCGFFDGIYYLLDYLRVLNRTSHIYRLRNGSNILIRNGTSDRSEMVNILSRYEYGELCTLKSKFNKQDFSVVDAGTNIGLFTIFLNAFLYKPTKLILIEPDRENLKILNTNLKLNRIKYSALYKKALYHKTSHVSFNTNYGFDSRKIDLKNGNIKVPTITLAKVFKDNALSKLDILKLDIEGGEWVLFNKGNEKYFRKIRAIILEYHLNKDYRNTMAIKKYFKNFKIKLIRHNQQLGLMLLINQKYDKN